MKSVSSQKKAVQQTRSNNEKPHVKTKNRTIDGKNSISYRLGSVDGMWQAIQAAILSVKYHQRTGVSRPAIVKFLENVRKATIDTRTRTVLAKVLIEKVKEGKLSKTGQSFKFKDHQPNAKAPAQTSIKPESSKMNTLTKKTSQNTRSEKTDKHQPESRVKSEKEQKPLTTPRKDNSKSETKNGLKSANSSGDKKGATGVKKAKPQIKRQSPTKNMKPSNEVSGKKSSSEKTIENKVLKKNSTVSTSSSKPKQKRIKSAR